MESGFIVEDGTSASAPIVSAVAAVLYSREDFDQAAQVTDLMRHLSVWGVIRDLDLQSPNRLVNYYPIVEVEQPAASPSPNGASLKVVF
jgi:subtilisin family serine protease